MRQFRKRRVAGSVIAAVAAVLATCIVQPPATADTFSYVSLGGSFAAGAGVPPEAAGSPAGCKRSAANFSHLVASAKGYQLTDMSCGGAQALNLVTSQVPGQPPQFDALNAGTDLVTMLIGYNNGSVYSDSINSCAQNPPGGISSEVFTCEVRNGPRFSLEIAMNTGPAIAGAIAGIKSRAPSARIIVLGYPAIFPQQGNCVPRNPFSVADTAYLNRIEQELNVTLQAQAWLAGVQWLDTFTPSVAHNSCQSPARRWIEPYSSPQGAVGLHPNAAGERAIADLVLAAIASSGH
ncbi:UNVERIFIED_CONTAM: GDSL-like lipase/acylhydrolase family protein [Williamsia faeni]